MFKGILEAFKRSVSPPPVVIPPSCMFPNRPDNRVFHGAAEPVPYWLTWSYARRCWDIVDDPDLEPHEDPRQGSFDFEFPTALDAGVPCG